MNQPLPTGSLRARMLVSATLVLVVFLGVMGLVLDNAYRESARQSVSERLQLHIYALIAATVEDAGARSLYLPEDVQEPMLNSMGSGLFGLLYDESGSEVWRSQSALDLELDVQQADVLLAQATPGVKNFNELAAEGREEPMFFLSYPIIWQSAETRARYTYVVLQNFEPYRNEVSAFRNNLWGWLIAGIIVLVGLQAAIMSWGLSPIGGLERDLKAIEEGEQEYLEGQYPKEIAGVTRSLNLLLSSERGQRERYRTTLADLAHSLKTPLAILKTEAAAPATQSSIHEQVDRMNEIVSYQLERAVSSTSALVKSSVPAGPVITKLAGAMQRVYPDTQLDVAESLEDVSFPGDERDLMEILGNVIDNACKYGDSKVRVSATQADGAVTFEVEDDGPGIDEAGRERVLQRGERLDTRDIGQGIGLAVVAEIVARYRGSIEISRSALGGARVSLSF